jgi:hypothetical protein
MAHGSEATKSQKKLHNSLKLINGSKTIWDRTNKKKSLAKS